MVFDLCEISNKFDSSREINRYLVEVLSDILYHRLWILKLANLHKGYYFFEASILLKARRVAEEYVEALCVIHPDVLQVRAGAFR